jgi:hypothetical protein
MTITTNRRYFNIQDSAGNKAVVVSRSVSIAKRDFRKVFPSKRVLKITEFGERDYGLKNRLYKINRHVVKGWPTSEFVAAPSGYEAEIFYQKAIRSRRQVAAIDITDHYFSDLGLNEILDSDYLGALQYVSIGSQPRTWNHSTIQR